MIFEKRFVTWERYPGGKSAVFSSKDFPHKKCSCCIHLKVTDKEGCVGRCSAVVPKWVKPLMRRYRSETGENCRLIVDDKMAMECKAFERNLKSKKQRTERTEPDDKRI